MKKILALAFVLMLGCDEPKPTQEEVTTWYVSYYKDNRTGFCFAGGALQYHGATLTHVPCTPEVEKLLKPWPN